MAGHHRRPREEMEEHTTRRRRRTGCGKCCAWCCVILVTILILLSLLGYVAVNFVDDSLSQVTITLLSFRKLSVRDKPGREAEVLAVDIDAVLEFDNDKDKVQLSYGPLDVDILSEDVQIGHAKIPGISQRPGELTKVNLHVNTSNVKVDDASAGILTLEARENAMIIDLLMIGHVGIRFGSLMNIKALPVEISCKNISQTYVLTSKDKPRCTTKILASNSW